jgi:quinol monooxygenase YgiN
VQDIAKEAEMVTMLFTCRVADYDTWRPLYEGAATSMPEVLSWQLWRSQDDPNLVFMTETFESREIAEEALASEEVQQEMAAHGVDASSVQYWFVDAVSEG